MDTSVFLSAGDPSGDNAASRLVTALRSLIPDLSVFGLGGEKLKTLGQRQLAGGSDLAVIGFWEVARRARFFLRLLDQSAEEIRRRRPAAIILVDYPGFNLRLARKARPLGIPIFYYISPQLWAWGRRRTEDIRELVDLMMVILPFEESYYRRHGIAAHFVGHYLLEDIPLSFQRSPIPQRSAPSLCLLPGSRKQEIERMLPPMLRTACLFQQLYGGAALVAGIKGTFEYDRCLSRYAGDFSTSISYGNAQQALFESNLVVTASGTATLETGIIGRPMVVVYKTGTITYQIARRLIKLDSIALVNLVLGQKVVPELIQRDANPSALLPVLKRYVEDPEHTRQVKAKLDTIPQRLGGVGASDRAARLIADRL